MKALTIWQPWATLLAEKHKKIETRSWATSIRGAVAIHAGKKSIKEVKRLIHPQSLDIICNRLYPFALERLPVGCVLAAGKLVDCKLINEEFIETLNPDELPLGDFTPGRYAWIFEEVKHFRSPIPAKGGQGFWYWKVPHGIEVAS